RAGRHQLPGEVIIQTYTPEHYSVQLAKNHDYLQFYRHEMLMRKQGQYPPFYYLVLIHINHEDVQYVYTVAEKIAQFLRAQLLPSSKVLGPAASPIVKIKNKYRYQVLIKYKHDPNITPALKKIIHHFYQDQLKKGLTISIDMNPYSLM